ncbi:MAG TPA: type II toxin-antitoxin system VapC family toxin [Kiritimatiellia bacterium]|nr:type II toxin-antitoxin system VapC family toxin [Kiritimatiellia bacterium]HMP34220.1 type II toxin-antitoxin system VapC family toxin [Kiritimatiellia bacterium]
MICVDTTVLVDLWRGKDLADSRGRVLLQRFAGEVFAIPCAAAGEFLEGAAYLSDQRLQEALLFLELMDVLPQSRETAIHFARAVAFLRRSGKLKGASKFDLWNAATAMEHGARFLTRNPRDFEGIPGLLLEGYTL